MNFLPGDTVRLKQDKNFSQRGIVYHEESGKIRGKGNRGTVLSTPWGREVNAVLVDWEGVRHLGTDISCIELEAHPVTDEEVAELFHLKPDIDWRRLFKEYAQFIGEYEGTDFRSKIQVNWTDEEWEAVNELLDN